MKRSAIYRHCCLYFHPFAAKEFFLRGNGNFGILILLARIWKQLF